MTTVAADARSTAVDFARRQIGKPYIFATSGPNSFDCSGLTHAAWQAAGLKLTPYTVRQYEETQHVPLGSQLPGDIILVGPYKPASGEPHHVVLSIGGDQCIEAYDAGYPVRQASIAEYNGQQLTVGRMPVGDSSGPLPTASAAPASALGTSPFDWLGSLGSGFSTAVSALTSAGFWRRIGLGLLGLLSLLFMFRWLARAS